MVMKKSSSAGSISSINIEEEAEAPNPKGVRLEDLLVPNSFELGQWCFLDFTVVPKALHVLEKEQA